MADIKHSYELPNAPECQSVAVTAYGGGDIVILALGNPGPPRKVLAWAGLNPVEAKQIAEQIVRAGYAVEIGEDVHGLSSAMVERLRAKLVVTLEHFLKSEIINQNLDNPRLTAEKCVELMLTEVV